MESIKLITRRILLWAMLIIGCTAPIAVVALSIIDKDDDFFGFLLPSMAMAILFVPTSILGLKLIGLETRILRAKGSDALKDFRKDNPQFSWKAARNMYADPTKPFKHDTTIKGPSNSRFALAHG